MILNCTSLVQDALVQVLYKSVLRYKCTFFIDKNINSEVSKMQLYETCTRLVRDLYKTCTRLVQDLYMYESCTSLVHFVHDLYKCHHSCTRLVDDLYTSCTNGVRDM